MLEMRQHELAGCVVVRLERDAVCGSISSA